MALLPTSADVTDSSTTNAEQKTYFAALFDFLLDLLGDDSSDKAAARAALGAASTDGSDITDLPALESINSGPLAGFRNRIINGSFSVNQRDYVSGTATASGTYMHDRWKSTTASSGYTFTQAAVDTTITIGAGTIAQVIEDKNVEGGVYTLSWTGTAQARIAINGAATSGAYAASPITTSSATAGQTITVEFGTGTLGKVQLEPGSTATVFERRPIGVELDLCARYLPYVTGASGQGVTPPVDVGYTASTTLIVLVVKFNVPPRIAPNGITVVNPTSFTGADGSGIANATTITFTASSIASAMLAVNLVSTLTAFRPALVYFNNLNGRILFTGCEL